MVKQKKLKCEICKKEIPVSVAKTSEGADYVHHFCSEECHHHYFEQRPEEKKSKKKK